MTVARDGAELANKDAQKWLDGMHCIAGPGDLGLLPY